MNKTKLLYLSLSIIGVGLVIIFLSNNIFSYKNNIISNDNNSKVYSSSLAMMLETGYDSGEYQESTDSTWADAIANGYTFNTELSKCENGSVLTWNDIDNTVTFTGNISDKCYVYFDKVSLSNYIISLYTEDGENGLYYHDGLGTYGEYEAGDYSYRYSGTDPDNYVCFGTDTETCPVTKLYRIIGVFDNRIKLIKYDYATSTALGTDGAYLEYMQDNPDSSYYKGSLFSLEFYYWNNDTSTYTWSESNLNTVNLNTNYWNYLGTNWQNYIDDNSWVVSFNTFTDIFETAGVKNVYTSEIVNTAISDTYTSKIGLMYVSEYMYAADPTQADAWSALMGYNSSSSKDFRAVTAYNWMHMGAEEFALTMSKSVSLDSESIVYGNAVVLPAGQVGFCLNCSDVYSHVRPVFYLKPGVTFESGSGTKTNPYRIEETVPFSSNIYWNGFVDTNLYYYPDVPSNSYNSVEEMRSEYESFDNYPFYIKTTDKQYFVCLYYNNNEFCIDDNYYDTDMETTLSKMKVEMAAALGLNENEIDCFEDECLFATVDDFVYGCGFSNSVSTVPFCGLEDGYYGCSLEDGTALCNEPPF